MKSYSRRKLLGSAAGSAAFLGLLVGSAKPGEALAGNGNGNGNGGFSFEVVPDLTTLDFVRELVPGETFPTGPFYVSGTIYRKGGLDAMGNVLPSAKEVGTFREWGWIYDAMTGDAVVNQSFEFSSGHLQLSGSKGAPKLGVTGGSYQFQNARGQGVYTVINPDNFTFGVSFKLLGAGGKIK